MADRSYMSATPSHSGSPSCSEIWFAQLRDCDLLSYSANDEDRYPVVCLHHAARIPRHPSLLTADIPHVYSNGHVPDHTEDVFTAAQVVEHGPSVSVRPVTFDVEYL